MPQLQRYKNWLKTIKKQIKGWLKLLQETKNLKANLIHQIGF
jgi:hypothetical protein